MEAQYLKLKNGEPTMFIGAPLYSQSPKTASTYGGGIGRAENPSKRNGKRSPSSDLTSAPNPATKAPTASSVVGALPR